MSNGDIAIHPALQVGWTKSPHANDKPCVECGCIIGFDTTEEGYAPCFMINGVRGSIIGPCLDRWSICSDCIHEELIVVDLT